MITVMVYNNIQSIPHHCYHVEIDNEGNTDFGFDNGSNSIVHIEGKLKDFEELYNKAKTAASLFPQSTLVEEEF